MTAELGTGAILFALLGVTVPVIAIGTLIWRLADRTRGLQASVEAAAKEAGASSEGVKRIEANVAAMRDELHRDYVRQDSLRETESRIGKRIDGVDASVGKRLDDVEHTVRNTAATIIAALARIDPPARRSRARKPAQ